MHDDPTTARLDALADELLRVQDAARSLPPITDGDPDFDPAAAARVARRLRERRRARGDVTVGRKIGFTNEQLWPRYGVHQPIWGPMYTRTVFRLPGTDALGRLAGLVEPRIEPEIVLGLVRAPQPGMDAAALAACVGWAAHGFEIVQSHFPGWRFRAADTIAVGALHGQLYVGPPQPLGAIGDDPAAALAGLSLALARDGVVVDRGRGGNALGGPLQALAHLVRVLADEPGAEPLAAGEIVTTGTLTDAWPVAPGEVWHTQLLDTPLPGLRISFCR